MPVIVSALNNPLARVIKERELVIRDSSGRNDSTKRRASKDLEKHDGAPLREHNRVCGGRRAFKMSEERLMRRAHGPAETAMAPSLSDVRQGAGAQEVTLNVNGVDRTLTVEPRVTLLDALRDRLGLTGTKKGCDQGSCGACTVLVNGRRIDSCLTLALMHVGDRIVTIEGIASGDKLHPIQRAFIKHDGFQCGYCTPGQIVSAVALLNEGRPLDRSTIARAMSGNICRCGCYPHINDAILEVSGSP
jgi:xanthine dehydrogenase YagT iron-sulfur-binding subunit